MDADESDPNCNSAPLTDSVNLPSAARASPAPDAMSEVIKPTGNTRVKVIPVSAIQPATEATPARKGTGFLFDEPDFRRSSRVQPAEEGAGIQRAASRSRSFIVRRMDEWDTEREEPSGSSANLAAGSIAALPIAVQAGFRRKVLFIFDLQLLLLTGVVSLLTYEPNLASLMDTIFFSEWILLAALGAMILALVALYQLHSRFPWNWVALVVFTIVFSVLIVGAQVVLCTHAGVFCSAFTFLAMCVMTVLCGIKRTKDGQVVFLSALVAGFVSYAVIAIGCAIAVGGFHASFLVGKILAYALVLEFALIMWFSYDAITIFRLITPDEYMHGVIYFYTDVLVLTMISVTAIAVVVMCTACGGAGGGGAGFGYINPSGCSTGGCCGCCGDGTDDHTGGEATGGQTSEPRAAVAAQEQRNETMDRG